MKQSLPSVIIMLVLATSGILSIVLSNCRTAEVRATQYRLRSFSEAVRPNNTLNNTNPDYVRKYRRIETYIPSESTPIKTVKVCFNVFTGPGGMNGDPKDKDRLLELLGIVNGWFANNSESSSPLPGVAFIQDTRIRYEVDDRIFFYDEPKLYKSCNVYDMEKKVIATDSARMNYLNVYFTFGQCTQHATSPWPGFDYYPTVAGMNNNQYVLMPIPLEPGYASAQTLAHELCHCLDLMHLYEGSCCHETCDTSSVEYLDDVFGTGGKKSCWQDGGWHCDPYAKSSTCTNNMMSGVAVTRYHFSPKQIGKMHRALAIKTAKRYVKDDDRAQEPYVISANEMWDFEIRWYSDIVIKKGAKLTLRSSLYMPQSASMIVERGGELVIEGGKIISSSDASKGIAIIRK
jgi:hypothetical protein